MFFSIATRPKVMEENPGIKFGDIGKKLGEAWKQLPEEEKEPFLQKAAEDKKRYEKEMTESKGGTTAEEDEDED